MEKDIFASISGDINSCFSSISVALILANTLLFQSKAIGDLVITSNESFYQKLQAGAQSSQKYACLLVCSYVRCYFKALHKDRAPVQAASNMSLKLDRAGVYLWAIAQSCRFFHVLVSHRWKEHHVVSSVIDYRLFCFMVPLNTRNVLKLEF